MSHLTNKKIKALTALSTVAFIPFDILGIVPYFIPLPGVQLLPVQVLIQ
jgi:hypothetical protein